MAQTADDEAAQVDSASHVVAGERVLVDELATWLLAETPRPRIDAGGPPHRPPRPLHPHRSQRSVDRVPGREGGRGGHGGMRSYGWHSRLLWDFFGRLYPS
jgi:hypothetical protein